MAEDNYTRCPGCRTVFRVTAAQLALREGQVRCGHCRTVFDGSANRIQLAAVGTRAAGDDGANGPLTVTLRSADALQPVVAPPTPPPSSAPSDAEEPVDYDRRFAWDRPKGSSPKRTALYGVAIMALTFAFAGQLAWHYRDALAAHFPPTRQALTRWCAFSGCAVRPLREIAGLSIDASDLQADPAHKGLLVLSATVRNRANYAVAYPHLELTLTDLRDNVVVRRTLGPAQYAGGTLDLARGIAGNGELLLKVFLDASATTQSGYRVYLFYP